ncbi:MAG: HDOD domain-containing protein [Fimbriimonas sp.]
MPHPEKGIDRFLVQCKRATSLPTLPHAATALVRVIDTGEASALDLERIIAADPSLCAMLMRVAASRPMVNPPGSLRTAIMRIGQREIRSVAISLAVKQAVKTDAGCGFDVVRFARHSLYVGFLARYLAARRQRNEPFASRWSADELFAAGVVHDIGLPLLAKVAPEDYVRVELFAKRTGTTFKEAFARIYECELSEVGSVVAQMWDLPSVFPDTMRHMHAPWRMPQEMVSLSAVSYADYLADTFGASLEDWTLARQPLVEAEFEVGIPPEEQENLREVVEKLVNSMMEPVVESRARMA